MSNNIRDVIFAEKNNCGTQHAYKELAKSLKLKTYVIQLTCYKFQQVLRQIKRTFGMQLTRGVPKLTNTRVEVE